jgi:hypothetical protein
MLAKWHASCIIGYQLQHRSYKVTQFAVVQDNRTKQVTIIQYEGRNGPQEISFLNGIEATLNNRGRYIQAKSSREDCARILPDEVPAEEAVNADAANADSAADAA